jgi:hypothetical protein
MANKPATVETPRKTRGPKVHLPDGITFEADPSFKPVTKSSQDNPFLESIKNASLGVFHPFPSGLSVEQDGALVNRLRSAGQALGFALSFRVDATSGRPGWKVTGPIKHRTKK